MIKIVGYDTTTGSEFDVTRMVSLQRSQMVPTKVIVEIEDKRVFVDAFELIKAICQAMKQ